MTAPLATPGQLRDARTAYDASCVALSDAVAGFALMQGDGTDKERKAARRRLMEKVRRAEVDGETLRRLREAS